MTPGHGVYKRLEKLVLLYYTVGDPVELPVDPFDGFCFSRVIYIAEAGREALRTTVTPCPPGGQATELRLSSSA